ncbi:hypothetical protein ABH931_005492 [Streptacidiphilus sp. MAP12-33]
MLPPRLLWCDPGPIPRFNKQERVTVIVRDPGFADPPDADDHECSLYWSICQTHERPYIHEQCGEGPHLIAHHCEGHGPVNIWPDQRMLMFPEGFDPPLSEAQLAWVRSADDEA